MAMDTYSPSHPTDDNDTENNDEIANQNKSKPNNIESHNNIFNTTISKTANLPTNGFIKINTSEAANESPPNAWDQELAHTAYKSPKKASKSPPRTVSKQPTSHCRENSSRSGHRRSRSRSANRRDRSRSANRRGRSRSGNKRFSRRRSYSRSRSRNRRSRSRNRGSRNDSQANRNSRLNVRDSRENRRPQRSKSPPLPQPPIKINKESQPLTDVRRSPEAANSKAPVSDSPKQKWSYDSEEEDSAVVTQKINTFSDNRGRFQQNFDNRQFNSRNSEENSGAPPHTPVTIATQKINTFSDNRGRFQRNFDNRRNNDDNYDNKNSREIIKRDDCNQPINKTDNCDSEEEFGAWGKKDRIDATASVAVGNDWSRRDEGDGDRGVRYGQQENSDKGNSEGGFVSWKNAQRAELSKSDVAVSDKFVEGSDEEEFGAWGKETAGESKVADSRVADTRVAVTSNNNRSNEDDEDDDFGAWGSELKSSGMGKAAGNSVKEVEVVQEQQSEHRQSFNNNNNNFSNNNNFNTNFNNNNQFGQRNYINNRFPMQNNHDNRFPIQNNQDNRFPLQNNQDNRFPLQNIQDNRFFNPQPNMFPVNYHPGAVHRPQLLYNQWNTAAMPQLPAMPYPPRPLDQLPFPLDMSVCPPLTTMMPQQQLHRPPLQQMMPFVPPPPPSSMSMDVPMAPGNAIINHPTNINQLPMNINHQSAPVNRNQPGGLIIGQPNLININTTNRNQQPMNSTMMIDSSNLLETLMTKAGLPSDTLRLAQEKKIELSSRSVGETFNTILKTAASSVISRLVENSQKASDNMSMSPPSPPAHSPPLQAPHVSTQQQLGGFVPPPLPNYNDILRPPSLSMNNSYSNKQLLINNLASSMKTTTAATNETVNVDEEKINRSDFSSKNDWQERVALEVKMFLKPAYTSKSINKNDYKEIMKRCVTKITRSGVTEINRDKIEKFVLSYVDKYNKNRKTKQHSAVSSSERDM